jgi:hypothetical protein
MTQSLDLSNHRVPFTFAAPLQQPFRAASSPIDAYRTAQSSPMSNAPRRRATTTTPPSQSARTSVERSRQQSIDRMNSVTPSGRPRQPRPPRHPRHPYPSTVPEDDVLPSIHEQSSSDGHMSSSSTMYVVILPHKVRPYLWLMLRRLPDLLILVEESHRFRQ